MNLNKVFIIGRLTADPQLRTTTGGNQVTSFSMATNRVWNDKIAGKKEETEFHNIVLWGRTAEIASRFLTKGSLAMIEGRLQTRSWEDQQGQKRKTTEIVGERLTLGPRTANQQQSPQSNQSQQSTNQKEDMPSIDVGEGAVDFENPNDIKPEDLPF